MPRTIIPAIVPTWRSKDGVETPISELGNSHLRAIILMVVERRAPMPPQWPALVNEATKRGLGYVVTGDVPPAPPLLPEYTRKCRCGHAYGEHTYGQQPMGSACNLCQPYKRCTTFVEETRTAEREPPKIVVPELDID